MDLHLPIYDVVPLYMPIRKDGPTQSATHVDAVGSAIEPLQPRARRKKKKTPAGTEMNYTPALAGGGGLDVVKYDSSQPRGKDGRWSKGGGSVDSTPVDSTPPDLATPHDNYRIDPMFFHIAVEDRLFDTPVGKKITKKAGLDLARNLLTKHGFTVVDGLPKSPEQARDPKTVCILSEARYFKPPFDPKAGAFVTPITSGGETFPSVAMVISPREARPLTVIHELAHVVAGDPEWAKTLEAVDNPHRVKWLDTYARLLKEEGYDEASDRVAGFAKMTRTEAESFVSKAVGMKHCWKWSMDLASGRIIPREFAMAKFNSH